MAKVSGWHVATLTHTQLWSCLGSSGSIYWNSSPFLACMTKNSLFLTLDIQIPPAKVFRVCFRSPNSFSGGVWMSRVIHKTHDQRCPSKKQTKHKGFVTSTTITITKTMIITTITRTKSSTRTTSIIIIIIGSNLNQNSRHHHHQHHHVIHLDAQLLLNLSNLLSGCFTSCSFRYDFLPQIRPESFFPKVPHVFRTRPGLQREKRGTAGSKVLEV